MSASGMRKAAVVLASLHPHDRAWLLEHLRPTWRYDLKRLMREASQRGAGDNTLLDEVLSKCHGHHQHPEPPAPDHLLAGLRELSPQWTARVLAACAPDHLDLYAASATPGRVRETRHELLNLPEALPPKLAEALAVIVRRRGERGLSKAGAC